MKNIMVFLIGIYVSAAPKLAQNNPRRISPVSPVRNDLWLQVNENILREPLQQLEQLEKQLAQLEPQSEQLKQRSEQLVQKIEKLEQKVAQLNSEKWHVKRLKTICIQGILKFFVLFILVCFFCYWVVCGSKLLHNWFLVKYTKLLLF